VVIQDPSRELDEVQDGHRGLLGAERAVEVAHRRLDRGAQLLPLDGAELGRDVLARGLLLLFLPARELLLEGLVLAREAVAGARGVRDLLLELGVFVLERLVRAAAEQEQQDGRLHGASGAVSDGQLTPRH
jgi:hypothetical protein